MDLGVVALMQNGFSQSGTIQRFFLSLSHCGADVSVWIRCSEDGHGGETDDDGLSGDVEVVTLDVDLALATAHQYVQSAPTPPDKLTALTE